MPPKKFTLSYASLVFILLSPCPALSQQHRNLPKHTPEPTITPSNSPTFPHSPFPTLLSSPPPTLTGTELSSRKGSETSPILSPNPTEAPTEAPVTEVPTEAPVTEAPTTPSPSLSFQPSYSPSVTPTISKTPSETPSAFPTYTPSFAPSLSSFPSAAPWTYERPKRVDIRYLSWDELDDDTKEAATNLDYDASSWENYGENDVEYKMWNNFTEEEMEFAEKLGYDERSWDCWQNHYEAYRWIDLPLEHIQASQWFDDLGYTIDYWNGYTNATSSGSESRLWYELSHSERHAASQLCFIRRSWDEIDYVFNGMFPMEKPGFRFGEWSSLEDGVRGAAEMLKYDNDTWNVLGLHPVERRGWTELTDLEAVEATKIGWSDSSWDCWINHFKSYSWEDIVLYGLDFDYTALGWDELSWEGENEPPPSNGKYWDLLNDTERLHASNLCYFRDNWDGKDLAPHDGPFPYRIPVKRYVPWKKLSNEDRQRAYDSLFYDEDIWNVYGVAEVEKKDWKNLTEWEQGEAQKLGFYPSSWDCFQNHYATRDWDEINWDVRDSLNVLGWSNVTWDNETWAERMQPDSYGKKWETLNSDEQNAAYMICYFNVNWPGGTDLPNSVIEEYGSESNPIGDSSMSASAASVDSSVVTSGSTQQTVRVVTRLVLISVLSYLAVTATNL